MDRFVEEVGFVSLANKSLTLKHLILTDTLLLLRRLVFCSTVLVKGFEVKIRCLHSFVKNSANACVRLRFLQNLDCAIKLWRVILLVKVLY